MYAYMIIYNQKTTTQEAKKDLRRIGKEIQKENKCLAVIHEIKSGAHIHLATEMPIELDFLKDKAHTKKQIVAQEAVNLFMQKALQNGRRMADAKVYAVKDLQKCNSNYNSTQP